MIIFLAGSINSGKSTVAKLLIQKIPNCAHLEVDKIIEFVDHLQIQDLEVVYFENIVSLIKDYVKNNLNVIVSYTFSDPTYDYIINKLKDLQQEIYLFTLNPQMQTAMKQRGERVIEEKLSQRVRYQYEMGINNLKSGITIDNSNQTPDQTAQEILNRLN